MTINGVHIVVAGIAFLLALTKWSGQVPAIPSGRTILASIGAGVMGLLTVVGALALFAAVKARQDARISRRAIEDERRGLERGNTVPEAAPDAPDGWHECLGPSLGRACLVCGRHPENVDLG